MQHILRFAASTGKHLIPPLRALCRQGTRALQAIGPIVINIFLWRRKKTPKDEPENGKDEK